MNAKHTSGPWVIQWGRQGTYPLSIHNRVVNIVTGMGRKAHPEAIHNALLIAAAPDLLEYLIGASNYIDSLGGNSQNYRRAIARATGAES